ncbi:branched-chain-amino-acid transaminase [Cerasicoccus frondis]|uniref:branched-chain-amino-acid transaminase n=1 Tax=Cerasicoccus frondis TaxID=490090 RepID=UPI002852D337|nr:branched-chain-amino-acid transaminase [Cerasicoccus frondis]
MKVYMNGDFVDQADAKVSVFDHGFLYGDGIFEGIRLYNGNVYKLDEHLERLEFSARAIMLDMPWSRAEIAEAVCESCRVNGLQNGYIRLIVSRGVGSLGLSPKSCSSPQLIIIADQIQLYPKEFYTDGLKVITVATRRNNPAALPPMIKSLNYLNNILAKIEAGHLGYVEAFMLNDQGYVAECTGDNVFIVQHGKIFTPPVNAGSLTGITRQAVLEIAKDLGIEVVETNLTRYDLWIAKECFLSGTAAEVVPVVEIDGRVIGDGKPGSLTKRVLEAFHGRVSSDGTRI